MKNKTVLVIGDTHEPFCHKQYLPFCKRIEKAFKCDTTVHIGDLVDNHAISYHEHDPDGWSPESEMRHADKRIALWFKAFPQVKLCFGNHDRLPDRKGKTVGLPRRCFRSFRDMWNLPKSWETEFAYTIGNVKYTHGTGYSGDLAHLKAAHDNRMSCVIGHLHSVCGIDYSANEEDCIFGMSVGCGIDRRSYAFEYGRDHKKKPILACGVVEYTDHGVNARVIPMELR